MKKFVLVFLMAILLIGGIGFFFLRFESDTYSDPVTGMEFVRVEGGCFQMGDQFSSGDRDELPLHEVCIDDFYIGRYEVTRGEFSQFTKETGYLTEAEVKGDCWGLDTDGSWTNLKGKSWKNLSFAQDDKHPVVAVSGMILRQTTAQTIAVPPMTATATILPLLRGVTLQMIWVCMISPVTPGSGPPIIMMRATTPTVRGLIPRDLNGVRTGYCAEAPGAFQACSHGVQTGASTILHSAMSTSVFDWRRTLTQLTTINRAPRLNWFHQVVGSNQK